MRGVRTTCLRPRVLPPREVAREVRVEQVRHADEGAVERGAEAEAQPDLAFDETEAAYERPPLNLLTDPNTVERHVLSDEALEENARMLENVLDAQRPVPQSPISAV